MTAQTIPALHPVGHCAYSADAEDAHGNPIAGWAEPVDKKFIAWARFDTTEPKVAGHNRDVVDAGILVYPDFGAVNPKDRMVIDGQTFEVIGEPERADKAWFDCAVINWCINLQRVGQ